MGDENMMELIKLGDKTYYLKNLVNIGIYVIDDKNVCVIDTGNSKDYGKLIENILVKNNWHLKYIINTHSHADHIGGNKYLQDKYNCQIYSSLIESYFINTPLLEPSLLYGSIPLQEMNTLFLCALKSKCEDILNVSIPGIKIIDLKGHSVNQIGIVTSDDVCFVGDAYTSREILTKYKIQYTYDIDNYLKTLEYLKNTNYKYYVPAHGNVESNILNTINSNIENIISLEKMILNIIKNKITYNDLLKEIFKFFHIKLNVIQYHLISATIKAFITKLNNDGKIKLEFNDGEMLILSCENKE